MFVGIKLVEKKYWIIGILYLLSILFVMNDAWLYHTPIAKLTKVETSISGQVRSTRGTEETRYKQKIQGIILNGKNKGKEVHFSNEYTDTGMLRQPYHKGDKVLLNGSVDDIGTGVRGLKRDTIIVSLLGILIIMLILTAGRQGIFTFMTVTINIIVFIVGFWILGDTSNILKICNEIVILFAVVTLIGLNGIHRKTWAALLSTLCVIAMIMIIFDVVVRRSDLDYSTMEYLGLRNIENTEEIFHAEIILSGLGAVMDVAVAISAALSEIIEKKSNVTFGQLFQSGREIGYDIMGTMLNVLMCVFVCELIPMCLIQMNNDVRLITIIKLNIPCEICRFLIECIGIVWAIPVSIVITSIIIKISVKVKKRIC